MGNLLTAIHQLKDSGDPEVNEKFGIFLDFEGDDIKPDSNNIDDQDDLDTRGDEALEIEDYATTMYDIQSSCCSQRGSALETLYFKLPTI